MDGKSAVISKVGGKGQITVDSRKTEMHIIKQISVTMLILCHQMVEKKLNAPSIRWTHLWRWTLTHSTWCLFTDIHSRVCMTVYDDDPIPKASGQSSAERSCNHRRQQTGGEGPFSYHSGGGVLVRTENQNHVLLQYINHFIQTKFLTYSREVTPIKAHYLALKRL